MAQQDTTAKAIKYSVIAAGIGVAAGMLFAPKSGREMRGDMKEKAVALRDKANHTLVQGKEKAQEIMHKTSAKAQEMRSGSETLVHSGSTRPTSTNPAM